MTTSSTFTSIASVVTASFGPVLTAQQLWNGTTAAQKAGHTFLWTSPQGNLAVSSFDGNGNWIPTVVNGQGFSDTLVRGGASDKSLMAEITTAKTVVAPTPDVTTTITQPSTYTLTRDGMADIINELSGDQLTAVSKAMFGPQYDLIIELNIGGRAAAKAEADALATWGLADSLEIGQFSASELAALQSVGLLKGITVEALNNVVAGGEAHVVKGVLGTAHTLTSLTASLNGFINGSSFGAADTLYMKGFMTEGAVVDTTITKALDMFVAGSMVERVEQASDVIIMNAITMLSTGDTFTVGTGANYTPDAIASLKREWDNARDARIENLNDLAVGLNKIGLIGVIDASDIAALAAGHTVYA